MARADVSPQHRLRGRTQARRRLRPPRRCRPSRSIQPLAQGGEGALPLAKAVMKACEGDSKFKFLYDVNKPLAVGLLALLPGMRMGAKGKTTGIR